MSIPDNLQFGGDCEKLNETRRLSARASQYVGPHNATLIFEGAIFPGGLWSVATSSDGIRLASNAKNRAEQVVADHRPARSESE